MDEHDIWSIYFSGVCAFRFHPRNDSEGRDYVSEVEFAALVADLMLEEDRKRWDGHR